MHVLISFTVSTYTNLLKLIRQSCQHFYVCHRPYFNKLRHIFQVQITVLDKNDSPPSFKDTPLQFQVSEDLGPGEPIATIRAEDPDTIGDLEYTLVKGHDGRFTLDRQGGVLRLDDSLDRETKDIYKLTVRASDGLQYTDTIVTIQVCIFFGLSIIFHLLQIAICLWTLIKITHKVCHNEIDILLTVSAWHSISVIKLKYYVSKCVLVSHSLCFECDTVPTFTISNLRCNPWILCGNSFNLRIVFSN